MKFRKTLLFLTNFIAILSMIFIIYPLKIFSAEIPQLNIPDNFYFKLEAVMPEDCREGETLVMTVTIGRIFGNFNGEKITSLYGELHLDTEVFEFNGNVDVSAMSGWKNSINNLGNGVYTIVAEAANSTFATDYSKISFSLSFNVKSLRDKLIVGERRYIYIENTRIYCIDNKTYDGIGGIGYSDIYRGEESSFVEFSEHTSETSYHIPESSVPEESSLPMEVNIEDVIAGTGLYLKDNFLYCSDEKIPLFELYNTIKIHDAAIYDSNKIQRVSGYVSSGYILEYMSKDEKQSYPIILRGDTNGDGIITAIDYLKLRLYILGLDSFNQWQAMAGDVDDNDSINALDYYKLRLHILNISRIY